MGAGEIPVITVLNKTDKPETAAYRDSLLARFPESLAVSAKNGNGLDDLKQCIVKKIKE